MTIDKIIYLFAVWFFFYIGVLAISFPVAACIYGGVSPSICFLLALLTWPVGGIALVTSIDAWREFRKG